MGILETICVQIISINNGYFKPELFTKDYYQSLLKTI